MRWLLVLVAACSAPQARPTPAPPSSRLDAAEIESATGTAAPFLHPVAGHDEKPGISLDPKPDARTVPLPDAPPAAPDAAASAGPRPDAAPSPDAPR